MHRRRVINALYTAQDERSDGKHKDDDDAYLPIHIACICCRAYNQCIHVERLHYWHLSIARNFESSIRRTGMLILFGLRIPRNYHMTRVLLLPSGTYTGIDGGGRVLYRRGAAEANPGICVRGGLALPFRPPHVPLPLPLL